MIAITVPFLEKFACVVADKIIGLSRHPDYFEYHFRLRDLKKIRIEGLSKFIRVDGQGQVESIVLAETLLTKGAKVELQPVESLTNEEKAEIAAAVELVNQPEISTSLPEGSNEPSSPTELVDAQPEQPNLPVSKRSKKKPRSKPSRKPSAVVTGE